jgi:TolA-binding protein
MRRIAALELFLPSNDNKSMRDLMKNILRISLLASLFAGSTAVRADSLAERDYALAKSLFDSGKESEALLSISDFLRRHPQDLLADDAQFLAGEIYFHKRDFQEAINEFRKVGKYPKGDRLAAAHLRIGECQQNLGNVRAALIEFEAVRRRYPKGPDHDQAILLIDGLMKSGNQK